MAKVWLFRYLWQMYGFLRSVSIDSSRQSRESLSQNHAQKKKQPLPFRGETA